MEDVEFSDEFCRFIQQAIPSVDTAEILLFLHGSTDRAWSFAQIVEAVRPNMEASEANRAIQALQDQGLVTVGPDRLVQYRPRSGELGEFTRMLALAYTQRPVTLIRIIYALRDKKLRTFADAFKFTRG